MRYIPLVFGGLFCVFMLQSLGRTLWVNHYEFEAARAEWSTAHERGDIAAEWTAYHKEEVAHCRTLDPFWFYQPWANKCSL